MKRALKVFGVAIIFAFSAGFAIAEPKHAIAIIGEPALPAGFAHLPYVNPDAPQGGRINYGVVGTFDNVNPFILKSMRTTARGPIDTAFGNLVFESLMVRSADEPFTLYGLLAETIDTDEARTFAEFQLNPAAKWSDGNPVTPEDVIFTYETFAEKGRPPFSSRKDKIAKIEKTGERRVRFTFNEKSDREFPLIIALTPIIPKHASPAEFDQPTLEKLVGSGPGAKTSMSKKAWTIFLLSPSTISGMGPPSSKPSRKACSTFIRRAIRSNGKKPMTSPPFRMAA